MTARSGDGAHVRLVRELLLDGVRGAIGEDGRGLLTVADVANLALERPTKPPDVDFFGPESLAVVGDTVAVAGHGAKGVQAPCRA